MSEATEYRFDFCGGHLALDFVNTVGGMRGVSPKEHLHRYGDLLAFAEQAGTLSRGERERLEAEARDRPDDALAALAAAIELREALYRLFHGRGEGEPGAAADLAVLNRALGAALAHRELVPAGDRLAYGWCSAAGHLSAPLWPVASAAADLLASEDASRVRICGMAEEDDCSWVFLDRTKGRTRRWCSMEGCGNRAKARRHYQRVKTST